MTARFRVGIDALLADPGPIAGKRLGLITNPSGVTSEGVPTWKALKGSSNARLVRLFGPEHGLEGGAVYMEAVEGSIHAPSGLPVVSRTSSSAGGFLKYGAWNSRQNPAWYTLGWRSNRHQ